MSGADAGKPDFACRCLNVRIHKRQPGPDVAPQEFASSEAGYEPLFVGEDGIVVLHNQLTLRTRAAVRTDPSTSRSSQRTYLICLVCTISVYCVTTEIAQDAAARPGPVMPTEDWAERETLSSKTGWVEVHVSNNGCIGKEEAEHIMSSTSYSKYFSVDIGSAPNTSTTVPLSTLSSRLSIPASHTFLPSLPDFLPPPPFTPSHPIFYHLSSLASAHSSRARVTAEKRVEEFAKQQLAEVEAEEVKLKDQIERLWINVREELKKYERERDGDLVATWQARRRSISPRGRSSSLSHSPAVIRDFTPSTYSGQRLSRSTAPRQSGLSASLATSTFHHPRARQEDPPVARVVSESRNNMPSPPPYASNPTSPVGSNSSSDSTSSSTVARSLRRNMNGSIDTAATYRWYVIEEQEAARRKAKERRRREGQEEANKTNQETTAHAKTRVLEKNPKSGNGDVKPEADDAPKATKEASGEVATIEQSKVEGKKGKRHVSFKTEPAVVTIKREINNEKDQETAVEGTEDLLFDIDDNDVDRVEEPGNVSSPSERDPALTLPLLETSQESQSGRARRRTMELNGAGLPQSFAALRPSSLPTPSNVRPPIRSSINGKKSSVRNSNKNLGIAKAGRSRDGLRTSTGPSDSSVAPFQTELRKLVAAESPSHRGSWGRDSDSWKIFDRRRQNQPHKYSIPEEEENNEDSNLSGDIGVAFAYRNGANGPETEWSNFKLPGLASSVPVPMAPISQLQLSSNGRSLQPKTSLTDRPGTLVPPLPSLHEEDESTKKKSPAAIRKDAYMKRDRLRAMDPGVLDFLAEEDDDDDDDDSPSSGSQDDVAQVSTSRGRVHALKILKAGSSVPDAGLWRSMV